MAGAWGGSWGGSGGSGETVLVDAIRTADVVTVLAAMVIEGPATANVVETTSSSAAALVLTAEITDTTEANYE